MNTELNLADYIKYCHEYISLTRRRTLAVQQKHSIHLPEEYFSLLDLLNLDLDGRIEEPINLETFYSLDPKDVTEEKQKEYEREKVLANRIEEIYNKYRNDQFTKQIFLSFGYFETEIPVESEENETTIESEEGEELKASHPKVDRYPLFALPVRIEKENGKYVVYTIDPEIQVNIGMLQPILGDDAYLHLVGEIRQYEREEKLSLPITEKNIFVDIWHIIKGELRLTPLIFNDKSFKFEEMCITLSPRANYFLADDMQKLLEKPEEELRTTALTTWTEEEDLALRSEEPRDEDLYFPFLYNKHQLHVLSYVNNKAAIVEGPPGTGKSETIANLICHFAATGKKVLFVSQKAQAIKVVKDKLKTLDVKYLFGYIPNPRSDYLGEEDKIDGVAPLLSGLKTYAVNLEYKGKSVTEFSIDLASPAEKRKQLKSSFVDTIKKERTIWELHQELKSLSDFDIFVTDVSSFEPDFSSQQWKNIKKLKADIEEISNTIRNYEHDTQKEKFDRRFSDLFLHNSEYVEAVEKIKDDVEKFGVEGKLHNWRHRKRTRKERRKLPRELVDYIDMLRHKAISKNTAIIALEDLHHYCTYRLYKDKELGNLQTQLKNVLEQCGLSDSQFVVLDNLIGVGDANEIEETKNKVLRVHDIKKELDIHHSVNINEHSSTLRHIQKNRRERIALYLQNILNNNIKEKCSEATRKFTALVNRLAKSFGKSKKAFKTFDRLRSNPEEFAAILDIIPVWTMELDDASRIVPLEAGIFDYVILDEASQCNIAYTLPSMFRAKRALFFGDSEQMKDTTTRFIRNTTLDALACRYKIPEDLQIKATGSTVQSVLDMAGSRGFRDCTLQYYYRSPNEIIGFSNENFYKPKGKGLITINSNYLTYKDSNRIMIVHHVDADWKHEVSDKINIQEAVAILELFKELRSDERYRGKSVAILSFFNAQATFIRKLFEDNGYKEEKDNYKVSIIEGIQGDEKDIVVYSFVIRTADQKNKYMPLTGEGGDIRGEISKGRVNVAFSRARLQTHCFLSMPISKVPKGIWLKKYLEHVEENGKVSFDSKELKPFDSYFEEEFYNLSRTVLKEGYRIQNQVKSCGFKIDFVISNSRNGEKIAVECDGPTHFKDEIDEHYGIYVKDDEERQCILEDAGWEFFRIKYSDWIAEDYDKSKPIKDIIQLLNV